MALPATRTEFKNYCLRNLGFPVIGINIDDMQVDDRIDEALAYWNDYHYDGSTEVFLKHQVTANNRGDAIYDITIDEGGIDYANGELIIFTANGSGSNAAASVLTDANGTITSLNFTENGENYANPPTLSVNTASGTGASFTAELGGFIPVPENVIGVVDLFDIGHAFNTGNMFSVTYQFFLNEMYSLATAQIQNYYMSMQHLRLLEEVLIGKQPMRYNRHQNRLYIDLNWDRLTEGMMVVAHGVAITDPNKFTDVWKDRWLLDYATALIQRQWGRNLTKFIGGALPGGLQFNGQQILMDAQTAINQLHAEMSMRYTPPVSDFIG